MRKAVVFVAVLALVSCMKKEPDGTYKATNPSDTAKLRANAAKAGDRVKKSAEEIGKSDAVQKIKAGSKELGEGVKEGVGHAAQVAGAKLEQAGKKVEESGKKPDQTTRH